MNIVEKNEGVKILYSVQDNKISFNDELSLNLERYERDDPNHVDICRDKFGNLVTGVIPGLAEKYVAQIDIPARTYIEIEKPQEDTEMQSEIPEEMVDNVIKEPVPFNIENCTLTLWSI